MPQSSTTTFSGIFVSYRRDDNSGHAGRLFDRLVSHFGKDRIFMDIDTIEPGEDFVTVIENAVGSCEILLAIIGRDWLSGPGETMRRLDNPNDFVRLEIGTALDRDIRVIPVLVQRASMPKPQDLPDDLKKFTRRNAVELTDIRWKSDVDQLIAVMEKVLAKREEAARLAEATRQEEAKRQREEEARQRREEEQRREQEQRREEEERKNRAEEAARLAAAEEQRALAEKERREAEEQARLEAAQAAATQAEEERRQLEIKEERRRKAEELRRAEEETKQRVAEGLRRQEEERRRREAEERLKREAAEVRRAEIERALTDAETRKRAEEKVERLRIEAEAEVERRRVESEKKAKADAESVRPKGEVSMLGAEETLTPPREGDPGIPALPFVDAIPSPNRAARFSDSVMAYSANEVTPFPADSSKRTILLVSVAAVVVAAIVFFIWMSQKPTQQMQSATNPKTQTTSELVNATQPPPGMVYVSGGEFMMGRNKGDGGDEYEHPAHKVIVQPFFIDSHEVTCQEFLLYLESNVATGTERSQCSGIDAQRPVTGVTWEDANSYAKWVGKRLPTEEEWEFAARGTDGRLYPWGNEWLPGYANANGLNKQTIRVGALKSASPFEMFDLSGNAWEWTSTKLTAYPGGVLPLYPDEMTVIRGGSYFEKAPQATTTYRGVVKTQGDKYDKTGLRCVKDVSNPK